MRSALNQMRGKFVVPGKSASTTGSAPSIPPAPAQQSASDESFGDLLGAEAGAIKPVDTGGRVELTRPRQAPARPPAQADQIAGKSSSCNDSSEFWLADVTPLKTSARTRVQHQFDTSRPARSVTPVYGTETDPPVPSLDDLEAQHGDVDLFRAAVGNIREIDSRNLVATIDGKPKPKPIPRKTYDDEQAALQEAIDGPISLVDHLDIGDEAVFLRHGVPRRVLPELRRGRWAVQAYLDLHGMTRDHARSALVAFLNTCLRRGHRCVRIIHGKGLGSPDGVSVLKQLSPGWLAQREEILAFCQAAPNHGGAGALMVLLRGSSKR